MSSMWTMPYSLDEEIVEMASIGRVFVESVISSTIGDILQKAMLKGDHEINQLTISVLCFRQIRSIHGTILANASMNIIDSCYSGIMRSNGWKKLPSTPTWKFDGM